MHKQYTIHSQSGCTLTFFFWFTVSTRCTRRPEIMTSLSQSVAQQSDYSFTYYFQFSDIFFLLRKFKTVPIVIKAFKLNLHFGSASLIRRHELQVALLYFRTNNLDPPGSLYRCCLVLWVLVNMSKVQCSCFCVVLLEVISLDESSFTFQIWKVEPVLWEFGKKCERPKSNLCTIHSSTWLTSARFYKIF